MILQRWVLAQVWPWNQEEVRMRREMLQEELHWKAVRVLTMKTTLVMGAIC